MRGYLDRDDPGGFRHVAALDGVRGVAVTLTVGAHLWLTNEHPGSRVITLLTTIRMSMWLGVDLFLALSGFLITGIRAVVTAVHGSVAIAADQLAFYERVVIALVCLAFVALCVRSFVAARKSRVG